MHCLGSHKSLSKTRKSENDVRKQSQKTSNVIFYLLTSSDSSDLVPDFPVWLNLHNLEQTPYSKLDKRLPLIPASALSPSIQQLLNQPVFNDHVSMALSLP